jgi:hypothetical protein
MGIQRAPWRKKLGRTIIPPHLFFTNLQGMSVLVGLSYDTSHRRLLKTRYACCLFNCPASIGDWHFTGASGVLA